MEQHRVEMSVGSGMVNGDHLVNGILPNGSSINSKAQPGNSTAGHSANNGAGSYTNGEVAAVKKEREDVHAAGSILQDAPPEVLQALSSEFYLPMARLISRSAQSCWNDLSTLVDRLASMPVSTQNTSGQSMSVNDQSKPNLEKKDLLLNFAKDHKDTFIKLLVLLQWSRKSEDVRKTIELNLWLQQRRQAFNNATGMLGAMMRGLADSQVPNPDLYTASEVLATGNVSSMPKLGYIPQPPLSSKRIIRLLRRLDTILCTRMALAEDIPSQLQSYHIHDGRVTFTIDDEFSFDVSLASEEPQAKFGMVDFRFLFSPTPSIPDGLHDEISYITNAALDKDGFIGVYHFLHDLTLSYKLNEFAKQARKLAQGLWNGHLRVEVLRRTLVVQYWVKNSIGKSWLELGIHSGRRKESSDTSPNVPELRLRWLREGKLTDSTNIHISLSQLSFEDVLRQVIAQHTNYLFDAIYDKLLASPIYSAAQLELEQSTSNKDPAECALDVQLSKKDPLRVVLEPISGALVLSPVNEKINRLQFDLGRSKTPVEDFVSHLPSLRSSTAEANLMKSLPNSLWQPIRIIDVKRSEGERLFGHATTRVMCTRLHEWTSEWLLAITQSATGDLWWLIHCIQPNRIVGSRITKLVDNHPLYLHGLLKPAYLERLADYATGVMALQCNAESLNRNKYRWRLPDISTFRSDSHLPVLQFSRSPVSDSVISGLGSSPHHKTSAQIQKETATFVHLTYHGTERLSKKVIFISKSTLAADQTVLKHLVSSKLDQSVDIVPEKHLLRVRLVVAAGESVIEELLSKLAHLENIVACVVAVNKSTEHKLQSLSLSSITILYHTEPDLSLRINFGQAHDLSVDFLPAATNPQRHLSNWVIKCMRRKGYNSNQKLSNIFVVLRMTRPIMSYLEKIQTPGDVQAKNSSAMSGHLRVHVLHRQPTAYGLQYFADSSNFVRDEAGPDTPSKLLARFEILAMKRGDRLMWMIRPAIEEFNSYNRPSYTSAVLRKSLNQEIFQKQSALWLPLDGGAACPSDKPEQLLTAIHNTIVTWAKEAIKPEVGGEQRAGTVSVSTADGASDKKSVRPNPTLQKPSNPPPRPNGIQRPAQQMSGQQRPQNFSNRNQTTRPSEVITLD